MITITGVSSTYSLFSSTGNSRYSQMKVEQRHKSGPSGSIQVHHQGTSEIRNSKHTSTSFNSFKLNAFSLHIRANVEQTQVHLIFSEFRALNGSTGRENIGALTSKCIYTRTASNLCVHANMQSRPMRNRVGESAFPFVRLGASVLGS